MNNGRGEDTSRRNEDCEEWQTDGDDTVDNTGDTLLAAFWGASTEDICKMMPADEHDGDNDSMCLNFLMMVLTSHYLYG